MLAEASNSGRPCAFVCEHSQRYSISQAQYFRGISAREIFRVFPGFRARYPKGYFWSRGNFYRSVLGYYKNSERVHRRAVKYVAELKKTSRPRFWISTKSEKLLALSQERTSFKLLESYLKIVKEKIK